MNDQQKSIPGSPQGNWDSKEIREQMFCFDTITDEQIRGLQISPQECVEWAKMAFLAKKGTLLPHKSCMRPTADSFFTAMPCCIPSLGCAGVKVISRIPGNEPSLKSTISLCDMKTGDLRALLDGRWITSMRTGATATLAATLFASDFSSAVFGLVGMGDVARSLLKCLLSVCDRSVDVWLLEYKGRASAFAHEFKGFKNVRFHVAATRQELVDSTTVLFSCVTVMNEQFLPPSCYPPGYTCIPVHTKGFQDCDSVFDHVFGDDLEHIRCFDHFSDFRSFAEIGEVLSGHVPGRISSQERILSYNVGIALLDVWFASKIYDLLYKEREGVSNEIQC